MSLTNNLPACLESHFAVDYVLKVGINVYCHTVIKKTIIIFYHLFYILSFVVEGVPELRLNFT